MDERRRGLLLEGWISHPDWERHPFCGADDERRGGLLLVGWAVHNDTGFASVYKVVCTE
jgi:hypothetical protein